MALLWSLMLVTIVTPPIRGQYSGHVIFSDKSEARNSKIVREASCSLIVNGLYLSSYKVGVTNFLNIIHELLRYLASTITYYILLGDRAWTSN